MKKKSLSKMITTLIIASLFLSGCGTQVQDVDGKAESKQVKEEQEEKGEIEGIRITDGKKYALQLVKPEDIVVEFSGLKPDMSLAEYGGRYVTDTATYMSDTVGIYLDEKRFEAKVGEYVEYTDFSWSWDSERNYDLFVMAVEKSEVSPDFFKGSIVYSDGNEIEVKPDKVSLEFKGSEVEMVLSYRGIDSYEYFAVPDNWSDGEWRDEHLYEDPNESTPSQPTSTEDDEARGLPAPKPKPLTTPEEIAAEQERREAWNAEQERLKQEANERRDYASKYYASVVYIPEKIQGDEVNGNHRGAMNHIIITCANHYANTGELIDLSAFADTYTFEEFKEQYWNMYPILKGIVSEDIMEHRGL